MVQDNRVVAIDGCFGDALRIHARELTSILDSSHVDLTDLGKVLAKLSVALVGALDEGGKSSLRFHAVAKSLDLKTPRAKLTDFLGNAPSPGERTGGE